LKKRPQPEALDEELENKTIRHSVRFREIGQLTQKDVHYTYSFHETDFPRRLHRYCLEYAFRLFADSRSEPLEVYRVFRLVPCIQDKTRMYPYFRRLVSAGTKDALELPTLPFYAIGGAGTHYPRKDEMGNPVYPSNTRLPRRVLGMFHTLGLMSASGQGSNQQNYLELCGYGGKWFDCRDVEGYLREQGVDLDGSSLFPSIHNPRVRRISQSIESQGIREGEQDCQFISGNGSPTILTSTHKCMVNANITKLNALTHFRHQGRKET
jgi:hypothetical protein